MYSVTLGSERVKGDSFLRELVFLGDSFLTLSLPRGLPLMSKIVWR